MNPEIEVLASELKRVAQMLQHAGGSSIAREVLAEAGSSITGLARQLYDQRRRRNAIFGADAALFGEPAWDMLLDILVAEASSRQVSVTSVCLAAHAPATTSLRYLASLQQAGLIEREQDENDGRRWFVKLSQKGASLMQAHLGSLLPIS